MVVVKVQVRVEPAPAFVRALVAEAVGPLAQEGLDHPLDLAVRSRGVRACELVFDAELYAERAKRARSEGRAVVGQDAIDANVHPREPGNGSEQEPAGVVSILVVKDSGERETRVIVGGDEDELEALLFGAERPLASDPMTGSIEAA